MKKCFILLLSLCCIISSCGNLSEKEIEETTSTGVVLVQNQSYYEVVLSNGESLYFSGFDDEEMIIKSGHHNILRLLPGRYHLRFEEQKYPYSVCRKI